MLMDNLESGESYLKDGVPIRTTWGQTLFRHYYEILWVSANPYVLPSTLKWGLTGVPTSRRMVVL